MRGGLVVTSNCHPLTHLPERHQTNNTCGATLCTSTQAPGSMVPANIQVLLVSRLGRRLAPACRAKAARSGRSCARWAAMHTQVGRCVRGGWLFVCVFVSTVAVVQSVCLTCSCIHRVLKMVGVAGVGVGCVGGGGGGLLTCSCECMRGSPRCKSFLK